MKRREAKEIYRHNSNVCYNKIKIIIKDVIKEQICIKVYRSNRLHAVTNFQQNFLCTYYISRTSNAVLRSLQPSLFLKHQLTSESKALLLEKLNVHT